jgi:hypothetical protein
VDDDTLETLRASTDELVRSSGMPSPGSLSSFSQAAVTDRGPTGAVILVVFGILAIGGWYVVGVGVGVALFALAAGLALAGLRGRNRPGG